MGLTPSASLTKFPLLLEAAAGSAIDDPFDWGADGFRMGHTGRAEEARAIWEEVMRVNPDCSLEGTQRILPYEEPERLEFFVDGLRKAGLAA